MPSGSDYRLHSTLTFGASLEINIPGRHDIDISASKECLQGQSTIHHTGHAMFDSSA